jgi:ATP-dependent helicase HrpA
VSGARTHPRAAALAAARAAATLVFQSPDLPIVAHREAILDALQRHQVIIVAGETGSGKSTQLPQYCLAAGRGLDGVIAHTQPRRLAARALAARIAEELSQTVGSSIGFKVRFADHTSDATRLLLMTDGLLLAELTSDPLLTRYDTIIVDEAHERSLNVDLLLGVLKGLLPQRPDLKVIVTSATLDVERMAAYFGEAPVIRVSGRSFPVEVRFRELSEDGEDPDDPDLSAAVLQAFQDIAAEPGDIGSGDVLVFLPGEREIRDVGEFLERELGSKIEVLPLYSRLAWEQQQKIFQPTSRQRIVLATNVAETSITVPGIRSVIDSGLARISRYSLRSRLQRLAIERVSQASAEQRKGRCGRLGAGLCLRLYPREDYESRAPFTEPEILRTNLAALLLRLAADGLGAAEQFPFIDAPDARALHDGYRLLQELQALDEERRITRRGRAMARLPLDPRLARALLESQRHRAESEVLAIAAGLSVPDARLAVSPAAGEAAAAVFDDPRSEFLGLVRLWRAYRIAREGTRRELRAWCKAQHVSLLRLSEWDDVHAQVAQRAREIGIVPRGWSGSYTAVHRALLAGFCTLVGARGDQGAYLGTRGIHFHLFPGSPLAKRKPRWVMAANIVETSRVFGRRVAQIEPQWVEAAAAHLLKREYLQPDWDEEREEVVARERIGFFGLTLSANRMVNYGPIAPEEARRIFAREALVYGRLKRRPDWLRENDAALAAAQRQEERLRSRDLLQNPEALVEFYDLALPRQVSSAATLDYFNRHLSAEKRAALLLKPEDIYARTPDLDALRQFPEASALQALTIPIDYRFAPGESHDGASLMLPLLALPQMTRAQVLAAVPGFAAPRIEALLRSLPKETRRLLIPIAKTAQEFVAQGQGATDLGALRHWLHEQRGVPETQLKFDPSAVPAYLTPQLVVVSQGQELARGTELAELRRHCAVAARAELSRVSHAQFLGASWRSFQSERLPDSVLIAVPEGAVTLFPTLAVREQRLEPALEWSADEAAIRWRDSAVRLARMVLGTQARDLARRVSAMAPLILSARAYFDGGELIDTLLQRAFRSACFADSDAPREATAFNAALELGRARLHECLDEAVSALSGWLADAAAVRRELEDVRNRALTESVQETREHLQRLFDPEWLNAALPAWLRQVPRYLKAEQRRWQRNAARGAEAASVLKELTAWSARLYSLRQQVQAELRGSSKLTEFRLWIEEFRVSLYAQELKTLGPISAGRLEQRAAEIDAWLKR